MNDFVDKLLIGNCVDVLKNIGDNIVDLTVTSPPYDDLRHYNGYSFDFDLLQKKFIE